jgi:hypothetical protein
MIAPRVDNKARGWALGTSARGRQFGPGAGARRRAAAVREQRLLHGILPRPGARTATLAPVSACCSCFGGGGTPTADAAEFCQPLGSGKQGGKQTGHVPDVCSGDQATSHIRFRPRTLLHEPPTRGRRPVRTPGRGTPDDPIPGLRAFSPAMQTRSFQIANQDS